MDQSPIGEISYGNPATKYRKDQTEEENIKKLLCELGGNHFHSLVRFSSEVYEKVYHTQVIFFRRHILLKQSYSEKTITYKKNKNSIYKTSGHLFFKTLVVSERKAT